MLWRPDEPGADAPFSWVRHGGELHVFRQGRSILRLRGDAASRLAAALDRDGVESAQRILARVAASAANDDDEGPTLRAA